MRKPVLATAWGLPALVVLSVAAGGLAAVEAAAGAAAWPDHPVNVWVTQSPREGRPPAPKLQYELGAVYDPKTGTVFHQAGHEGIFQTERLFAYDLETGRWAQRFPNTSPPGACCVNNNGPAFDPANRRLVRFPAGTLGHGFQFSRSVFLKNASASVWVYDPEANVWTAMRPPPYNFRAGNQGELGGLSSVSTYDPVHEIVIHWPGRTSNLFAYDVYANALHRFDATNPPPPRAGEGMAYDSRRHRVVAFGSGLNPEDERTWIFDFKAGSWQGLDLSPHPPAKREGNSCTFPVMAYDSLNDVMLCVIWHPTDATHETWVLDLAGPTWSKMNPPAEPDKGGTSRGRNLMYSEDRNVFILTLAMEDPFSHILTYRYRNPTPEERPAPPTGLAVVTEPGKASLTWTASPTPGVKEYRVYRAEAENAWQAEYTPLGTATGTSFAGKGLSAGKVYFYKVSALGGDGQESRLSFSARTQPRVLLKPVVSVLAKDRVEVSWRAHPARDIAGYNLYRGLVSVTAVKKGVGGSWRDNDPEYPEPLVCHVNNITGVVKLNGDPVAGTAFTDTSLDLSAKGSESGDYKYAVYAYLLRAVNRLGTESGPSPYALTIPSEPTNVLVRSREGSGWELKWDANPEKGIIGYRVYATLNQRETGCLTPHTQEPVQDARFEGTGGGSRLWVTAVDALGQEGQPSSPANVRAKFPGFFEGEWHQ